MIGSTSPKMECLTCRIQLGGLPCQSQRTEPIALMLSGHPRENRRRFELGRAIASEDKGRELELTQPGWAKRTEALNSRPPNRAESHFPTQQA